jgi:transcriptional regulator with XRE-family HTH domain
VDLYTSKIDSRRSPLLVVSMQLNRKLQFGLHIRQIRKQMGYSQEKLADICGMDRTYIGGIERGERNVSLENILKIADAFEVSPERLFQNLASKESDGRAE